MQQSVLAGEDVYERAKVDYALDTTVVDLPDLGLGRDLFDLRYRRIFGLAIFRIDPNATVIIDVDFGPSFVIDRTDFLDVALLYSLINFIGVVAVLRFSKFGHFADS